MYVLLGSGEMISRFPIPTVSLRRSITIRASVVSSSASIATKTHPPLFLRPLTYSVTVSDLVAFRSWAASLATAAAPGLESSDGGPSASHLLRELSWLLEDGTSQSSGKVLMRVDLDELYRLWKERIERRRPFQYIVGCEHWRDLVLVVREGVLIPRPETEMIVDLVRDVEGFGKGLWADLGTGSGAIAVGIGRELGENGRVFATDLSLDAVEIAGINIERYGLKDKVEIRHGSWFEPLEDVKGKLTGLVSNPPYIPSSDIPGLQAEVGKHEPKLALDGGVDGTDHLFHLCEGSATALRSGGFFAFETNGDNQSELVASYLSTKWTNCFTNVKSVLDFAGIKRFVTGFRR
ncbi:putative peptide chain release factor N(5)-glutamine methyltransferase [Dioscorea sansibarensis]